MGPHLVAPFREAYDLKTFDLSGNGADFEGDLTQIEPLRAAMKGREVVVHLAATSDEAPFVETLVPNNVIGVYNVLEAAHLEGVRRVIFASTIQAVGGNLSADVPFENQAPPRPSTLYGVTKVLGETMGRWYHDKRGLEFIAIRIGAFQPYDSPYFAKQWGRELWLSPRDAATLFRAAIETPDIGYAIVNGTSNTFAEKLSLRPARDILGWEPQDDARDYYPHVK
jgi:uronate dehydrogenase